MARYDRPFLQSGLKANVEQRVKTGKLDEGLAAQLVNEYDAAINGYTYLE